MQTPAQRIVIVRFRAASPTANKSQHFGPQPERWLRGERAIFMYSCSSQQLILKELRRTEHD